MVKTVILIFVFSFHSFAIADHSRDVAAIKQVALDYIESQHNPSPNRMKNALHEKLAKRTFWLGIDGEEFIMETSYDSMIHIAETYNKAGDRFPDTPKKDVKILDIDGRVASVKLVADDWIDYMHVFKNDKDEWKIVNVMWQYHDRTKHKTLK
jgi:hypothetical protein